MQSALLKFKRSHIIYHAETHAIEPAYLRTLDGPYASLTATLECMETPLRAHLKQLLASLTAGNPALPLLRLSVTSIE